VQRKRQPGEKEMRIKMKLLTTVALLFAATPAWAITPDELLRVGAVIALFQTECGPLTPKMQAMANILNAVHGLNELDALSAVMNIRHVFETVGKDEWCSRVRKSVD
jgi:hypothetical protein